MKIFVPSTNSKMSLNIPQKVNRPTKNLNKIRKSIGRKGLLICSLNAPSLVKHIHEIEVLVVENKIDIIAINETKLESNIDNSRVALNDFSLLRCDRNRQGGAVAMYVRETIDFEHRTDLQTDNLEILCIEVKPKFSKSFLVLASYIIDSGVFTTGFSDHDLIYGVRKVSSRINREPKIIKSRQLKNYDPTKFRKELQQVDWESIIELNDVNAMSLEWEKEFIRVLDKHAPIRQRKVRNSYAPYIDKELKHKMFMRDFYKKRFSKTKDADNWKFYQDFGNTANVEKRKKKKAFYSHKLDESKNDIKSTWKLLNMAIEAKSKTTKINSFTIN